MTTFTTNRKFKYFTGTVSFCVYSGIKVAVGTHFHNTNLASRLLPSAHPVMELNANQLLRLTGEVIDGRSTATERYLLLVAWLKQLNLVQFHRPLHLEYGADNCWDLMKVVISNWYQVITDTKLVQRLDLPRYAISTDNAGSSKCLADYLQNLLNILERYYAVTSRATSALYADDEELDLVVQLRKIQNSYRPQRFTTNLGNWAIRNLRKQGVAEELVEVVKYYLFQPEQKLREDTLRKVITLCREELDQLSDATCVQAAIVLRHLEYKLENLVEVQASFGFMTITSERGSAQNYQTKTAVTITAPPQYKVSMAEVAAKVGKEHFNQLTMAQRVALRKEMEAEVQAAAQNLILSSTDSTTDTEQE